MSKLKYLIDGKADEQFENMLWCFGGGGGNDDDDDSGSDSGSIGGSGDSAFYDNERPGLTSQNRPVGGTTNVVQGTSQPREDRDPVMDIVTMGRPMTEPPAVLDTPLKREIAEFMFQDFANNLPPSPVAASPNTVMDMDDPAGDYMLLGDAPNLVMDMDDPAGDFMLLQKEPADISVGSVNMPPAVITDVNGQAFDTTTGELIGSDGSYFSDLGAGLERIDGLAVPTPPPPRFQTNAQKDFYENLAGQGDAAMNQFRAEVRNLNNRGLLGSQIAAGIGNDGVPNFDTSFPTGSQIRGVTTTNFVDLPVVGTVPISTYTGLNNPNSPADTSDDNDVVPPVANPMTGTSQCPDGYTFDDDLQACRRKTKRELQADSGTGGGSSTASGDMFYRRTSLDDAPANLPSGFNFADANRAFTQSYAFRPSFYRNPMDTTGFTKLL